MSTNCTTVFESSRYIIHSPLFFRIDKAFWMKDEQNVLLLLENLSCNKLHHF